MRVLLTGVHGFIGHHVALALLGRNHTVLGTDRITGAISAKEARIRTLASAGSMDFADVDLSRFEAVRDLIARFRPEVVIHLAAQFPIRHGPDAIRHYVDSNVTAWLNVAEAARLSGCKRMVYASSVMAKDNGRPSSLYGATKSFNELAAFVYAGMGMTMIGARYAAVYGPEIRRDSSTYRVAQSIVRNEPIVRFRGFDASTHMVEISEAAEATVRLAESDLPQGSHVFLVAADDDKATMGHVAEALARHMGRDAILPADYVRAERSGRPDLTPLKNAIGYVPTTTMEQGMRRFAEWMERSR